MYRIIVVSNNKDLVDKLSRSDISKESSEFEIAAIVDNGSDARNELKNNKYDLVIYDTQLKGANTDIGDNSEKDYVKEIIDLFEKRDNGIKEYIINVIDEIYMEADDLYSAENILCQIHYAAVEELFGRYEWLDLYESNQSIDLYENQKDKYIKNSICELFDAFCELFPNVNNPQIE